MVGNNKGWRSTVVAAVCVALAGCVGLGDTPSSDVQASRPRLLRRRLRRAEETPPPDSRIPPNAVAQGPDIPVVPVPPPPLGRHTNPPAAPTTPLSSAAPPSTQTAPPASTPPSPPPPQTASTPPAQPTPPPETPPHTARQLLQQASVRCSSLDSYIVRLTRREYLKGKAQPEEILLFKFRKNPFSVHFKWLGDTAKGREVLYVKDRYDNKIHTKLAAGDAPLMPAGARVAIAPDSMLARSASRHPITDAGICHCVESLLAQLDAVENGDKRRGTLTALAPQRRPEYPQPVETLERILPPGVEPELPNGGRRLIFFDPEWQLPLLVATYDDKGREVEYYRYDRLQAPVNLDEDDFNPDKLWIAPAKTKDAPSRTPTLSH